MSPRSNSRSVTPRRSSRSPYRRTARFSNSRHPPSPLPLKLRRNSGRYSSKSHSTSRSLSPKYKKRCSSRRYTRSRSKTRSRSRSRSPGLYRKNRRNNRENPSPSRCIGIFGLSINTTQHQIRELFEKFGPIERIQVVVDAQTGRSRGFCFIYYKNIADATAACDNCCGMDIDGRRIRVDYSVTERPHTPTPGVYKGQPANSRVYRDRYRAEPRHRSHRYRSERSRSRSRSYSPRRYRH